MHWTKIVTVMLIIQIGLKRLRKEETMYLLILIDKIQKIRDLILKSEMKND
jgi:hypothetical protein